MREQREPSSPRAGPSQINIFPLFPLLGPFWTHVLFTWTLKDGLKVYINGTFSIGDHVGSVSEYYGDPYPDLVIGTGNGNSYGHYVTGAFDEFIIWEKALSPKEILLYYHAAIGRTTGELFSSGSRMCLL